MNRRNFLAAAPAVVSLPSAVAGPAAAASSPVLDAGRRIAALNRQYEQADVPHADGRVLDSIWAQIWADEWFILDATPTTMAEAMIILMVAVRDLDVASACDAPGATVNRAMRAADRVTRFMASAAGVTVEEFGGGLYLPGRDAPSCTSGLAS